MKDTYSVEEVEGEACKNIVVRLRGSDISYIAQNGILSVYLDEDIADKIAFQINAIIEDRSRRYAEKIVGK